MLPAAILTKYMKMNLRKYIYENVYCIYSFFFFYARINAKKIEELQIIHVLRKSEATCSKYPMSIDCDTDSKYYWFIGMHILPATIVYFE